MSQFRRFNEAHAATLLRRPAAIGLAVAVAVWSATLPHAVAEQQPKVTITGGADASGNNYTWTVTNHYRSPIVYVEFPHYRAVLFYAPAGWSTKSTYLVNVGVPDRPGLCTAKAESVAKGIRPGTSAEFRMQVDVGKAWRGPGTVRIRFADGTETTVADVQLPQPKNTPIDKYVRVIGFFVIFVVAVAIFSIRQRKRPAAEASGEDPDPDAG